ncbi:MAG TPA: class I SAM-dependent methyltransferase, partial [Dongiaceae bacterium]|nr:class I SAM-dependent methyltransferase [Dongiaceae bacterium]
MTTQHLTLDYDAWAPNYDATRHASHRISSAILDALGPARDRSLLDIGGGTGNFAAVTRNAGFRVSLADLSSAMLRRARAKLGAGATLARVSADRLPFRRGSFDCAICINVLLHLKQRGRALAEARRVLRSGPLVIRTNTRESESAHWGLFYFPT